MTDKKQTLHDRLFGDAAEYERLARLTKAKEERGRAIKKLQVQGYSIDEAIHILDEEDKKKEMIDLSP